MEKIKAKVEGVLHKDNTHTGHSDPTGPHDSHLTNKADPRVGKWYLCFSSIGGCSHQFETNLEKLPGVDLKTSGVVLLFASRPIIEIFANNEPL